LQVSTFDLATLICFQVSIMRIQWEEIFPVDFFNSNINVLFLINREEVYLILIHVIAFS